MKKFFGVIGNPPYQEETVGGQKTYAPPIYDRFMDGAYEVGSKVELITPARFLFKAGSTPKAWNEKMLNDPHLKTVFYEANEKKLFPNTDITGGIVITYRDEEKDLGPIEVFSQFPEVNTIREKVISNIGFKSFSTIVVSRTAYRINSNMHSDYPEAKDRLSQGHLYDMSTNIFEALPFIFHENKPDDGKDYIRISGRLDNQRAIRWMRLDYLSYPENFKSYKLAFGRAHGAAGTLGKPIPARIIGLGFIAEPYTGTTESFLTLGNFETYEEANNALKYTQTKFARALLGILKVTQDITPEKWKFVPLQDFTSNSDIDWSKSVAEIDQQLYKKYGLSEDEIEFIETHVKEMN